MSIRHHTRQRKSAARTCSAVWLAFLAFAVVAPAELIVNYNFTTNAGIPDGSGQYTDTRTLGGLSSFSNITVSLNLTTQTPSNPMWLGDLYSTLTYGTASEANRVAVLLNRPGRDIAHPFGSSLSSLNVTLSEAAMDNIWGTSSSTGTYKSDGRLGVNPYGAPVNFNDPDRNATLSSLNGAALTSRKFTLLMADTSAGGLATLSNWGLTVRGTAAASGTMSADGGTMGITDDGGTNTLGANVVTTQNGSGGTLSVTATGSLTFSGQVGGSGALNKLGAGSLTLTNNSNNYSGGTTVNGGTLFANNTTGSATGTGAVVVSNSGTVLGGTGRISGNVTINSGAILLGGTGTSTSGTLTLAGSLTLNSNSVIELALGPSGAHSTLARTGSGTWTFQSNQMFNFADLGAQPGTYDNIITGLAASVNTAGWQIENTDWVGFFLYDGFGNIDLTLTAVPEPGTWLAGTLATIVLVFRYRKVILRKIGQRHSYKL